MGETHPTGRSTCSGGAETSEQADVETIGKRLVEIIVYERRCRIGGTLTLDDLSETEIGDWTMPTFRAAARYAAAQGWLIVQSDEVTLTVAGLRAA